jgi:predicted dehydrogenase
MHGRGVSASPNAELVGVYDSQVARAKAVTKKFGGRVFRSLEEVLSDNSVKAVHVLTPPEGHIPVGVASLRAVCQMSNGVIAHLWCSWAANDPTSDPWSLVYKVLGTKGGVVYSWNEAQIDDNRGPAWGLPCYEENFKNEIDHFIGRCILRDEQPLSTLADAADALKVIEAVERSYRHQRTEIVRYDK